MKLENQVALITGGATGIGRAIAQRFATEGARVAIVDINDEQGRDIANQLRGLYVHCDVSSIEEVQAAVDRTRNELDGIDVLVTSAALTGGHSDVSLTSADEWRRGLAVSLDGAFFASQCTVPVMIERGSGTIIHIASVEGVMGAANHAAYVTAKSALFGLTKSMAIDFGRHHIRVNAISPGIINSDRPDIRHGKLNPVQLKWWEDMTVLGRLGEPDEIATVAAFLASHESSYLTGQNIVVDGGWTIGHPPVPIT